MPTTTHGNEPTFPWRRAAFPPTRFGRICFGRIAIDGSSVLGLGGLAGIVVGLMAISVPEDRAVFVCLAVMFASLPVAGTVHEFAHILLARLRGYEIYSLRFSAGLFAVDWGRDTQDADSRDFIWIVLAGPGSHLVMGLAGVGWIVLTDIWRPATVGFVISNLVQLVANAIPRKGSSNGDPHPVVGTC